MSSSAVFQARSDYQVLQTGNLRTVLIATGAAESPYQLEEMEKLVGQVIRVIKTDAGVGEIKILPSGSSKFKHLGASLDFIYVGLQGQSVDVIALPGDGYYVVGGVIQAVAGEPSLGTGHALSDANRSTTLLVDTSTNTAGVWSAAVTISAAPAGAKAAYCMAYVLKAAVLPILAVEAATGYTLSNISAGSNYLKYIFTQGEIVAVGQWMPLKIHLDSNKQFKWCTNISSSQVVIGPPVDYDA